MKSTPLPITVCNNKQIGFSLPLSFLASSGNLFEEQTAGTFPTSTKQLYIFYEQGVKVDLFSAGLSGSSYTNGASNQFIDIAMHLFKLYKKIDVNNTATIVAPVELTNLQSLSTFCTNNSMFFNGIISKAVNIIDFITIATLGNATDFGKLLAGASFIRGCSSSTRGVFGGGLAPSAQNVLQFVTISTAGNSTDFGDLDDGTPFSCSVCSDAHGGLAQ